MNDPLTYPGEELALFQQAIHWKKYFSRYIRPYIKGKVLETGAGMGATTPYLHNNNCTGWVLLEPDHAMAELLKKKSGSNELPAGCSVREGTIDNESGIFDTILYIDVLEHIKDDRAELQKAFLHLNSGGCIVVLAPAHPSLFSAFDRAIGHWRRYTKKMLRKISPPGARIISNKYFDSAGYFTSGMNKLVLKQKYPTAKQVRFWDRWLVPLSSLTDKIFFHSFGRSIITVWRK